MTKKRLQFGTILFGIVLDYKKTPFNEK